MAVRKDMPAIDLDTAGPKDAVDVRGCYSSQIHLCGVTGNGSRATGTITFAAQALIANGVTLRVQDGFGGDETFEFRKDGGPAGGGRTLVDIAGASTAAQVAAVFMTVLDADFELYLYDYERVNAVVTLTTVQGGTVANIAMVSSDNTHVATVGFSGAANMSVDVEYSVDGGLTWISGADPVVAGGPSFTADAAIFIGDLVDYIRVNVQVAGEMNSPKAYIKRLTSTGTV